MASARASAEGRILASRVPPPAGPDPPPAPGPRRRRSAPSGEHDPEERQIARPPDPHRAPCGCAFHPGPTRHRLPGWRHVHADRHDSASPEGLGRAERGAPPVIGTTGAWGFRSFTRTWATGNVGGSTQVRARGGSPFQVEKSQVPRTVSGLPSTRPEWHTIPTSPLPEGAHPLAIEP